MVQCESAQQRIERVVEAYSTMMLRIALHYTKNQSDAEDAVQTVFLKLLRGGTVFENDAHEKAWLIRVTINQCLDLVGSAWHKRTVAMPEDRATEEKETHSEVMDAVRALPEKYRGIVYLYYYEGYATAEIAEMMGLARGTVESRLHRARAKLKTLLEGVWDA